MVLSCEAFSFIFHIYQQGARYFFYKERKTKNQTLKRYQVVEINQDKNAIAAEN